MSKIHPTSIISKGAVIGDNVSIGPFCYIGSSVTIGSNCTLESNVRIEGVTKIGAGNRFFHSAVIGSPCQDIKFKGEPTGLTIGDNNIFREFMTVNCSNNTHENTIIGNNCFFMAYSHVAHNCQIADNIIMANLATLAGHVVLDNFVTIGGLTAVHQFVKIGKYAFLGGASGIKKDVPPYIIGEGMPFKPAGLNTIGLRRRGFPEEKIEAIRTIYKLFYNSNLNVTQALQKADEMTSFSPEQQYFIDFIRNSQRGISK